LSSNCFAPARGKGGGRFADGRAACCAIISTVPQARTVASRAFKRVTFSLLSAVIITTGVTAQVVNWPLLNTYFELHVYGFPIDQTKTMETMLAKEVVANLK